MRGSTRVPLTMAVAAPPEALERIRAQSGKRSRRWLILGLLLLLAALGAFLFFKARNGNETPPRFETVKIEKGNLRETVIATGTLSPLDLVQVGAEVTGRVIKVNVDINDPVKEGQVLAEIDTEQLSNRVEEARAMLSSARSSYKSARASVLEAELKQKRTKELHERALASAQDLETANAALARAKASVSSALAQVTVANAGVKSSKTSLSKAIIRSPIDGVVLERSVELGATVTAGFQTPVLFTLAKGLDRLQLEVDVDEADVGKVKEGQAATFEVDAYPKRKFESKLTKLHNLPKAESTVVTYQAVLSVDNRELLLRPGMTATATIVTSQLAGVLLVPNAALRFQMPAGAGRGMRGPRFFPGFGRSRKPAPSGSAGPREPAEKIPPGADTIFLLREGRPRRVRIEAGATDGIKTEVRSKRLKPGMEVVVDLATEAEP